MTLVWEEGLWTVHSPSLPGVYGIGATEEEARADLADAEEALAEYLAIAKAAGSKNLDREAL